jgi:alanine-alpha-ketoisovalerate/valine-pyruvate aminotransferase
MRPGKNGGKLKSGNTVGVGRPKRIPELDDLLKDILGEQKNGVSAAKAILMTLRKEAVKGNIRAAEILLNRAYGLPKQSLDVNNTGTKPVEVRVKITKDDLTSDPIE